MEDLKLRTPFLIMLVGMQACGKSTWIKKYKGAPATVISPDDHLQQKADVAGKTYNEMFEQHYGLCQELAWSDADIAFANKENVIWDQTNLSVAKRKAILSVTPHDYEKMCVVFKTPPLEEWERRLASRPGKVIPRDVLASFAASYDRPSYDEGFDMITFNPEVYYG